MPKLSKYALSLFPKEEDIEIPEPKFIDKPKNQKERDYNNRLVQEHRIEGIRQDLEKSKRLHKFLEIKRKEREDQAKFDYMSKRAAKSGADITNSFNNRQINGKIRDKYKDKIKFYIKNKIISDEEKESLSELFNPMDPSGRFSILADENKIKSIFEKYEKRIPKNDLDTIRIKKKDILSIIDRGVEDGVITNAMMLSLKKLISEKDNEPVIKYLTKKGLLDNMNKPSKIKKEPKEQKGLEDGKYDILKGQATAVKKGKEFKIKTKTAINKDIPQSILNEASKQLRNEIDDYIKIKYFDPDLKGSKKKYRYI